MYGNNYDHNPSQYEQEQDRMNALNSLGGDNNQYGNNNYNLTAQRDPAEVREQ